jgi:hypothetical protein
MGYGKAEALLCFKHPYRFNQVGQTRWLGRIYGGLSPLALLRRPIIYFGAFGRGLFQSMYEPSPSLLAQLPFTLEWNTLGVILVLLAAFLSPAALPLAGIPLAVSLAWSIVIAWAAPIDPRFGGIRGRLLIALLTYLGPLVRGFERLLWRLRGLGRVAWVSARRGPKTARVERLRRALRLAYWNEQGQEKEPLLGTAIDLLRLEQYLVGIDRGWNPWDLEVSRGLWSKARLAVAVENHGGQRRLSNVRCELRLTRVSRTALIAYGLALAGVLLAGWMEAAAVVAGLGVLNLAAILSESLRLGRVVHHTLDEAAARLGLSPVDPASLPGRGGSRR